MAHRISFDVRGVTRNEAGGLAHRYSDKQALAQYALTGCLNRTLYTTAETQLNQVLSLCRKNEPEYVAKLAVYAREHGAMKDVPALLCVYLAASKNLDLLRKVFPRVVNNGKMLRNFVRILRSGVTGRKSLGSIPKRLVRDWFNSRTPSEIFSQSTGTSPSFRDILRLAHPRPTDRQRNALYGWFVGKNYNPDHLPQRIKDFEIWNKGQSKVTPEVPYDMLTSRKLDHYTWTDIAKRASWTWLRLNLNTMQRHGVFLFPEIVDLVARRVADPEEVKRARVFPYQIMTSYANTSNELPVSVRCALQDAMEVATQAVPVINGNLAICIDKSASMLHPITGKGRGAVTKVRCVDVAALMACTLLRKNEKADLIPFDSKVVNIDINPRDTVFTNAAKIGRVAHGSTRCSSAISWLNKRNKNVDVVWMISDNQSWLESLGIDRNGRNAGSTKLMEEWETLKKRCPNAKMVCVDIAPYGTAQTEQGRDDILNVGGWNDAAFNIANSFLAGDMENWSDVISKIEI